MAEKKTPAKKTKKPTAVTYKGCKYEVLERTEQRVCLTDGTIHFWIKAEDIEEA